MVVPSNKKYEKFWEKDELEISTNTDIDNKPLINEEVIETVVENKEVIKPKKVVKTKKEETVDMVNPSIEDIIENVIENNTVTVIKEIIVEEIPSTIDTNTYIEPEKKATPLPETVSMDVIYNTFIEENRPFRILHRGGELFNTTRNLKNDYPIFQHDGFVIFGKKYSYRGMRIEKI